MARITLGALTTLNLSTHLDPMFTELYGVADYFSTPVYVGATPKFYGDSNGDLGLSVSPSAWDTGYRAVQIAAQGAIWSSMASAGGVYLSNNIYWNGAARKYIQTDFASEYQQSGGGHIWSRAASGSAGATATMLESARLDASGNMLVNRTSQSSGGKVEIAGNLVLQPAAGAPTLGVNGDMSFQLVSNTSLKILVRGSDGTTRSNTLTLA